MIYWLNRRVERALESHLRASVGSDMRVYRSADLSPRQFPCVVVRAHENRRYPGELYAANRMTVSLLVMHEFARVVDGQGVVTDEFEDIEERNVSSVLEAVYRDDLAAVLEATNTDGVTISYAMPGSADGLTSASSEDGMVSIVEIPLQITAGAKEL